MIEMSVKLDRADKLEPLMRMMPKLVDQAAEDVAKTLRNLVIGRTPVASGEMKASWSSVEQTNEGFSFGSDMPYALILEEGRYQTVGGRTVAAEGGIFSRQAPGGMIAPVMEDQDVMDKVSSLVSKAIEEAINRAGA